MFNYEWRIANGYPAKGIEHHGLKVFTTFACGGGSTMGYKLAGYDVIGANDIDPQMAKVYQHNHKPNIFIHAPIGELLTRELPLELYDLDVLDGSPPCSTFSMAGSREKAWKKKKKFREGQADQVLSDLFFDWIKLVDRLKPKVAIAENVKGMLLGNAKAYTKMIVEELEKIGYDVQLFLLNSASMGVPQRRERVFFICKRRDLNLPKMYLSFNDRSIPYGRIDEGQVAEPHLPSPAYIPYWEVCKPGKPLSSVHPKGHFFNQFKLSKQIVCNTIASSGQLMHHTQCRLLTTRELSLIGSFPLDYDFLDVKPQYLIGMSVPPVMMANVAHQVAIQLFKK